MIRPSRRRTERADTHTALRLHQRLARSRVWTKKLWLASALSCGLSLVLWLFAVPVIWHLGAILLSFVLGLALPTRAASRWAVEWISRRGLSYLTALELSEQDPYGFKDAVQERAVKQATRLELPQTQAWWLPFVVVAVVLALLPIVPFRSDLRLPTETAFGRQTAPEQRPERGTDPVAQADPEEDEDGSETAAEQSPEAANETASTIEDFDAPGGGSPEANAERVADEEALERFLENMRERPQPEEQPNPFRDISPSSQTDARTEENQGERGDPGRAEAGEGQTGERQEGEEGENAQDGEQAGENGEGEQGETGQPGDNESEATGEQQGEEGEASAGDEQGDQRGEATTGEAGADESEGQGRLQEGEEGDGAGDSPGALSASETDDLESQGDPEQLRGQLQGGPSNLAGTTRLPGSQEVDAQAPGGAAPTFSQGDEQAITEGRIPVEYQEIIRNYFR